MLALTDRDYAGEADLEAVIDLWLAASAAGLERPWPPLDLLRAELAARPRGTACARLWAGDHDSLVGMAMVLDESVLVWFARPGADDEALEAEMISWGLAVASREARSSGELPSLFVPVRSDDRRLCALLERAGFQTEGWRMVHMDRSLREPIGAPQPPAGVVIRPVADAYDAAGVVALHSAIFAGGPKTRAERAALTHSPGYRPALDLVAALPDGTTVGYALGTCCALERQRLARSTGWIEYLGVERAQRGRGLGRALTLRLLHALRAEGLDVVMLTTGGANTAARHLFEACGFRTRYEIRWYVREADSR